MVLLRYLEESTLRNLIKRYSEFINFPILLHTTKEVRVVRVVGILLKLRCFCVCVLSKCII